MTFNKTYMTVNETAFTHGISRYFIRNGIKDGSIPYIRSGNRYLINVPALMEQLDRQSRKAE